MTTGNALSDWPKVFTGSPVYSDPDGYGNVVYYLNFVGAYMATYCFKSTDGGRTFRETGVPFSPDPSWSGTCAAATQRTVPAVHGSGVVDPNDGTVFVPLNYCGEM